MLKFLHRRNSPPQHGAAAEKLCVPPHPLCAGTPSEVEALIGRLCRASTVPVQVHAGPLAEDFQETVCALDSAHLTGVFAPERRVPRLQHRSTPDSTESRIVSIRHNGELREPGLKFVLVENWLRTGPTQVTTAEAVGQVLAIADSIGAGTVALALPNCAREENHNLWRGGLSNNGTGAAEYCTGVASFLQTHRGKSISRILLIWNPTDSASGPAKARV